MKIVRLDPWFASRVGKSVNPDKVFGAQCVDIPKSQVDYLMSKTGFWKTANLYGDAKDLYKNADSKYFTKTPYRLGTRFRKGDIVVWGAVPGNKYGHTAVVKSRRLFNGSKFQVLEQNGFHPTGVAYYATHIYTPTIIGTLRLKTVTIV